MAIKGKSKRRAPRAVARGPKPTCVPVKTPFFRRRGVWIAIAGVLGVAAIVGIVYGFVNQANEDREREELDRMALSAAQAGSAGSPAPGPGQPM